MHREAILVIELFDGDYNSQLVTRKTALLH